MNTMYDSSWRQRDSAISKTPKPEPRSTPQLRAEKPRCFLLWSNISISTDRSCCSVAGEPFNYPPKAASTITFPDFLIPRDIAQQLTHLCREVIRNRLLDVEPHEHLFWRIPRLNLSGLTSFLLYSLSPDIEEPPK